MKFRLDPGTLALNHNRLGVQLYWPIIALRKDRLTLSFSTVLVITGRTWQFDWSAGFQVLGFGFGVGKYMEDA